MPIKRVITKRRASLLAAAAAATALAGGIAVTPAGATVTAASTCSPKTDYTDASDTWTNWCGTGYRYPGVVYEVRDASAPYHRIWFHNSAGQAWCAWGPYDQTVPYAFNGVNQYSLTNVLISDNTNSC